MIVKMPSMEKLVFITTLTAPRLHDIEIIRVDCVRHFLRILSTKPDYIHIDTPVSLIGAFVKWYCALVGIKFTATYRPSRLSRYLRWFYKDASTIMLDRKLQRDDLRNLGVKVKTIVVPPIIDSSVFCPKGKPLNYRSPVVVLSGRPAQQQYLRFLNEWLPVGTRLIVGRPANVTHTWLFHVGFVNPLSDQELSEIYNQADCIVFGNGASTKDVMQALSCGVPVASIPVNKDIVPNLQGVGSIDLSFRNSIANALRNSSKEDCLKFINTYCDRAKCERLFVRSLVKCRKEK